MNLIVNAGSATVKYTFFLDGELLLRLEYEMEGNKKHCLRIQKGGLSQEMSISKRSFTQSFSDLFKRQVVRSLLTVSQLRAMGFRVVHGRDLFIQPTEVTARNMTRLKALDELAPLHNPYTRQLIEQAQKEFPRVKKLMVFDTAFHQTIPELNATYALPEELNKKYQLKRYGFHGIAYQSVVRQLQEIRRLPPRLIVCHLGSGCSVAALRQGRSVDTSMGFTPLEGLVMGTRAGDVDPGLLLYLQKKMKKSAAQIFDILNFESGLVGLTGSHDMKFILNLVRLKNPSAEFAVDLFCQRVAKYIAQYIVSLGGVDRIVFSGGIGENSHEVRGRVIDLLKPFGIKLHSGKNIIAEAGQDIQGAFSRAKICAIHVDEADEINRLL